MLRTTDGEAGGVAETDAGGEGRATPVVEEPPVQAVASTDASPHATSPLSSEPRRCTLSTLTDRCPAALHRRYDPQSRSSQVADTEVSRVTRSCFHRRVPTADRELLAKEVRSLVDRLRLWTPTRWAAAADPWGTRADLARHLAQSFVHAAGEVTLALPVLHPDLLVVDQLAVTGDDLVRADPSASVCADVVAHLLAHRFDLLGEEPPTTLGGPDAVRRGREVCGLS